MNDENLKRGNPATQFHKGRGNGRGAVENGEKSGRSRREKASIRQAVQDLLNGTYTNSDGSKMTGHQAIAQTIMHEALDKESKNWSKANDLLKEYAGENKTAEEMAMLRAQAALIQAKAELLTAADTTTLDKLDEILKEMKNNAGTESKTE